LFCLFKKAFSESDIANFTPFFLGLLMLSDFERVLDQVELESKVKFVILVLGDIEG
jgi:hypothetical protein